MIKRNDTHNGIIRKSLFKKMFCLLTVFVLSASIADSGAETSGILSGTDCKPAGTQPPAICGQGALSARSAYFPENGRERSRALAEQPGNITEVSERQNISGMGSVPYFRDDAGQNTQMADGYLYGYWNNRLCRIDLDTLEETVLYEALSPQHGDFCIWGDYIYFMVVPHVSVVGKIHGNLYRVKCDGSEEAVCLASVRMPRQGGGGQYYGHYILDTYEDILYLIEEYDDEENLYFRLDKDGGIARVSADKTLYGQLPAGYSARWYYNTLITLPYAMRNYGYVFAKDENENLVRIDLDSGQVEAMDSLQNYVIRLVTNDAVIAMKGDIWYRASLDDIREITAIGKPNDWSSNVAWDSYVAWDEEGLYFVCSYNEGSANLYFMDWQGGKTTLQADFGKMQGSPVEFCDGKYYIYVAQEKGDSIVKRLNLTGSENAEEVSVYEEDPLWDITAKESFNYVWTDDHTGIKVDCRLTEIRFKEDTGAFGEINKFLESLYAQDIQSIEDYKDMARDDSGEYGFGYVESSNGYEVCYMDENYVGICRYWYEYWDGAAHGMHGSSYYMLDRHTGEQIYITDVVNNTPEEICEIAAPYVEAASWGMDKEGWEAILLEEGRFYLSEEGIGFHFDTYEINSYAAGDQEIIVPYNMFEMKLR